MSIKSVLLSIRASHVIGAALVVAVAVSGNNIKQSVDSGLVELSKSVDNSTLGLLSEINKSVVHPVTVSIESVAYSGSGNVRAASVTASSGKDDPIRFCAMGVMSKKGAPSIKITSLPMCMTIQPFQTVSVDAPWIGGKVLDVCSDANGRLDFDFCEYSVTSVK